MFGKVRIRITLLAVALLVVIYTISAVSIYTLVSQAVMRQLDQSLLKDAQQAWFRSQNLSVIELPPSVFGIVDTGNGPLSVPINLAPNVVNDLRKSALKHMGKQVWYTLSINAHDYRIFNIPISTENGGPPEYFLVARDATPEVQVINHLLSVIWGVGIAGIVVATLAGFLLADRVLRPIRKAWQRQLEFVGDASHELRTPLAVIQSNLGIVMAHTDESVVDNLEWLNHAHSETRRVTKLVQDLLTLARSDSEKAPVQTETMDLHQLIVHVHELYEGIATMSGITLRISGSFTPVWVYGDKDRLHQLLVILLDNAVKFTEEGGHIDLRLSAQRNVAVIEVIDDGLGIASENLPRVFERFFTVDQSRSRSERGGSGLGLSIASWIVEAHHGKISLESDGLHKGAKARIELPLANTEALRKQTTPESNA